MTTKELYNAAIIAIQGGETEFTTDELVEAFTTAIEKIDAANAKKRASAAEKSAEKEATKAPLREAILNVMGDAENPMTATQLIEAAGLDIKPASMPSLLKSLIEEGIVSKVDVKIIGKGTQRGYVKA